MRHVCANPGLRTIFIIFWAVASVFWMLIGALDGIFVRSFIYIAIGGEIILSYMSIRDVLSKRDESGES